MTKFKWNWPEIQENLDRSNLEFNSISELADHLDIPRRTVTDAVKKGHLVFKLKNATTPDMDAVGFSWTEVGNEAWLKYKAAEPLSPEEASILGGVDLDIWEIEEPLVNFWQMGRKDKEVDMHWFDGKAEGHVTDTGKIYKTYLYQVKVKFTRKKRIAVIPVIRPISITNNVKVKPGTSDRFNDDTRILFITDPHFGFRVEPFSKPETFHCRRFLSDLLSITTGMDFDVVVWGGDILDLAEFSRFPKEPAIIQKTQIAGIEASWLINQFGLNVSKQVILEGNHDVRLRTAMADNFNAAYELRPVHDLDGEAMLSVPRFMGFDQDPNIEWIGDYPNGFYQFGSVRFMHAYAGMARKGSGSTVQAILKETTISTIFGHIHRYERASKAVDGKDELVVVGSPGSACRKETTPGANRFQNWSKGAFVLTFKGDTLKQVDDVSHENGVTYFRGVSYHGDNYVLEMKKDLPSKFVQAL